MTIQNIQDDFTIFPFSKVIRHDPAKSTIYSTVAFYSYIQDVFDEPGFLSYEIAMKFNTPTSFTMLNGWFMDDGDGSNALQYLTSGGIDTLGYGTISDPVYMIDLEDVAYHFVSEDLDRTVNSNSIAIGPLLSYKNDYPTTGEARIWVRDTRTTPLTLQYAELIEVDGGTSNGTLKYDSATGDNIYHNLFTIAAFPGTPDPQLYIYQDNPVSGTRDRISEWSAFSNFDRGTIDVLITTQLAGTLIDGGNISTFVRQTGDTFTFVESTLTTSGRTPIATETSADTVNITEGEHYILYDNRDYAFTAGDVISDVPIGDVNVDLVTPTWYAEVVSATEFADPDTGLLILRGLRGDPVGGDTIYVGSTANALVNGSTTQAAGDTLLIYDTVGTIPDTNDYDTIITGTTGTPKRVLTGFDTVEKYLIMRDDPTGITGVARNFYYVDFPASETVTGAAGLSVDSTATPAGAGTTTSNTLISGFNDVTIAHINGFTTVGDGSIYTLGERLTWPGGGTGIFVEDNSNVITIANVPPGAEPSSGVTITGDIELTGSATSSAFTNKNTENFAFSLQAAFTYAVIIEGGSLYQAGRTLTDIYAYLQFYLRDGQNSTERLVYSSDGTITTELDAEEYIKAKAAYNATKAAPFGTLAGGVFFGAQGVWIQGMASADDNNINLTDDAGTLQTPETSVTITISNTRADDRIAIFLESGATELPDKTQYTSAGSATNVLNGGTFENNAAAFPNDTPDPNGTFIAVDSVLNKQHRYRYLTRNGTTNPGVLTLPTAKTGTADGTTASEILEDSSEDFTTGGTSAVEVGDIIHRTSGTLGFAYVTSITNAATGILATTLIEDTGPVASKAWVSGDTYQINSLVKEYSTSDNFFVPYLDTIEDVGTDGSPGSVVSTLTFVSSREIILEVRNVEAATEIVPFKTTGQIGSSGYTQGVIRNEDTVTT